LAICPSCQAQIEIGSGFYGGLFTCPNCRAVYFIGFDGTPEGVQATPQPANIPTADYSPQPSAQNYQQEPVPEIPSDLPQVPPGYDGISSPMDYSESPNNDYNAPLGNDINDAMAPMMSPQPDLYNTPMNEPAAQPNFSPLQDVVDFANSDSTASLATYAVEITGLDSNQNIQAFREVLSDSKLQMNYEQYKPQIKNGLLRIEKLTAAQAAVIAFRLRPLPLEMKWEQSLL
jgi:hypothetical protein